MNRILEMANMIKRYGKAQYDAAGGVGIADAPFRLLDKLSGCVQQKLEIMRALFNTKSRQPSAARPKTGRSGAGRGSTKCPCPNYGCEFHGNCWECKKKHKGKDMYCRRPVM
jgi:hypothetical protein